MTRAQILALDPIQNPRLILAGDTGEQFLIPAGFPGSLATIIPDDETIATLTDLLGATDDTILRTTTEGPPTQTTAATGTFTPTVQLTGGDVITIGNNNYIAEVGVVTVPDGFLLGADLAGTLTNLANAITTGYPLGNPAHPDVTAVSSPTDLVVTATVGGDQGNDIITTAILSGGGGWASGTLTGGVSAAVADRIGQLCRVGDSSPYDWYQWDGSSWEYMPTETGPADGFAFVQNTSGGHDLALWDEGENRYRRVRMNNGAFFPVD